MHDCLRACVCALMRVCVRTWCVHAWCVCAHLLYMWACLSQSCTCTCIRCCVCLYGYGCGCMFVCGQIRVAIFIVFVFVCTISCAYPLPLSPPPPPSPPLLPPPLSQLPLRLDPGGRGGRCVEGINSSWEKRVSALSDTFSHVHVLCSSLYSV